LRAQQKSESAFEAGPIADEIIAELAQLSNAFAPEIRSIRRRYTRRLRRADGKTVLAIANRLMRAPPYGRLAGYELTLHHREATEQMSAVKIERLGKGLAGWGEVDTFACYITGPAWLEGRIDDQLIHSWARSDDRWKRRAALVSTVPLNAGHTTIGEPVRTLGVCKMLIHDRDDMVVKAMSWALRMLSTKDRHSVETFLMDHRAQLASRVIREVENKLETGLKNPKRRRSTDG
jgi:3-methyladenine DNA glycosylase AlkD